MPGGGRAEFFNLSKYKEELGRDYRRICLYILHEYLCHTSTSLYMTELSVIEKTKDLGDEVVNEAGFCLVNAS
jgi:hypothetical protein